MRAPRICRGMSWDVLLMRLPPGVLHLAKLPPAYAPPSLGARTAVAARLGELSGFELLDPAFGVLRDEDYVIEVGLGHGHEVDHLVLHVSGSPLALDVVRDHVAVAAAGGPGGHRDAAAGLLGIGDGVAERDLGADDDHFGIGLLLEVEGPRRLLVLVDDRDLPGGEVDQRMFHHAATGNRRAVMAGAAAVFEVDFQDTAVGQFLDGGHGAIERALAAQ